jgi:cyanophycinase
LNKERVIILKVKVSKYMSVGELLIIGGAEKKCPQGEVLNKFVELASKQKGGIGILPTASQIPDEVSAEYIRTFKELGIDKVDVLDVRSREDAEKAEFADRLSSLAAVFITGGDQSRLSDFIGKSKFHEALMNRWKSGMVLGGTSAGASIMAKHMIIASDMKLDDDKLKVKLGYGFGFLDHLLIDQHFSQRGRFDRLLSAIAENKQLIGIGIDENTAILVKDGRFEVFGQHQVLVMDGSSSDFVDIDTSENGSEELTISNFKLHTLTKGYSFDLEDRKLLQIKGKKE